MMTSSTFGSTASSSTASITLASPTDSRRDSISSLATTVLSSNPSSPTHSSTDLSIDIDPETGSATPNPEAPSRLGTYLRKSCSHIKYWYLRAEGEAKYLKERHPLAKWVVGRVLNIAVTLAVAQMLVNSHISSSGGV